MGEKITEFFSGPLEKGYDGPEEVRRKVQTRDKLGTIKAEWKKSKIEM